jgi:hypothetical protein
MSFAKSNKTVFNNTQILMDWLQEEKNKSLLTFNIDYYFEDHFALGNRDSHYPYEGKHLFLYHYII